VLHISAHAMDEHLALKNDAGVKIPLDAAALKAFMPWDRPPSLVYISACNSDAIAKGLTDLVPMAIGSTAPVTNRAARASAVSFYESLLREATVLQAHHCSRHMLQTLQLGQVTSELRCKEGVDPDREILYRVPRLIAKFEDDRPKSSSDGLYSFRIGVIGCPRNTVQIMFFTDDESFFENDKESLDDICSVTRGSPVRSVVWSNEEDWNAHGDFRICAAGLTGDGQTFSLCSMLCDAIEAMYKIVRREKIPDDVTDALKILRSYDGSELDTISATKKEKRRNRQ
jgi:hypothetical protein